VACTLPPGSPAPRPPLVAAMAVAMARVATHQPTHQSRTPRILLLIFSILFVRDFLGVGFLRICTSISYSENLFCPVIIISALYDISTTLVGKPLYTTSLARHYGYNRRYSMIILVAWQNQPTTLMTDC
jgi:hypothetical protein